MILSFIMIFAFVFQILFKSSLYSLSWGRVASISIFYRIGLCLFTVLSLCVNATFFIKMILYLTICLIYFFRTTQFTSFVINPSMNINHGNCKCRPIYSNRLYISKSSILHYNCITGCHLTFLS